MIDTRDPLSVRAMGREIIVFVASAIVWFCGSVVVQAGPIEDGQSALDTGRYQAALNYFETAYDAGDMNAAGYIGDILSSWHTGLTDRPKAVGYYLQAAEAGFPVWQVRLGMTYEHGLGVPSNYEEAARWYRRAADHGYALGQTRLGLLYEYGTGVPKDTALAIKLYGLAAVQGDLLGTSRLSSLSQEVKIVADAQVQSSLTQVQIEIGDRVALVIGNGAYLNAPQLANPSRDADAISEVLESIGFKVIKGVDLDEQGMETTLRTFVSAIGKAKLVLFYYSGHGLQVGGKNYLIPVDADLSDQASLDFEAIEADKVFGYLSGPDRVAIAFLDACRDNPFVRSLARSLGATRGAVDAGLAVPQTNGSGLFVGFATAPNDVASDGTGATSPFTAAMLKYLPKPGLEINQMMTRVKADVRAATKDRQRPWTNSDLSEDLYLVPASTTVGASAAELPSLVSNTAKQEPARDEKNAADTYQDAVSAFNRGDIDEAIKKYVNAADLGSAQASVTLGILYENGRGAERNLNEAVKWYRTAADQGNAQAMIWLADRYFLGAGVERNYSASLHFYTLYVDAQPQMLPFYETRINQLQRLNAQN